jgi:predicted nucleic acid-binding protein
VSIVIDASIALKWVFDERGTEAAIALLAEELIAREPRLAEAANALWRHVRLGETSSVEALARIDELANAPVALMSIEPYVRRSLQLATQLDHPVGERLYLALAEHLETHVITDDRRFFTIGNVAGFGARLRLLGD